MLRIAFLGAALVQANGPEVRCSMPVERVFLGHVAALPNYYRHHVVEICGQLEPMQGGGPGERVLRDASPNGTSFWIYVHDPDGALPADLERACVTGRAWRRDGLTFEQAVAQGRPNHYVADALQSPDYVFYPVRCGDGERG